MSDTDTVPPSDPGETLESVLRAITAIRAENRVWRIVGGVVTTVALSAGAVGLTYAQQAAADHERVTRLERDADAQHVTADSMRSDLTRIREDVAAIRGALGVRRRHGGSDEDE